jgi:branched-subunit amino acid ABC-type transport system permease component
MELWITQLFNGISYGALLFLLAGGLSLIFGMMRIVNMTHGSYYLLGGYVGLTVIWQSGHFLLAILVGAVAIALLGVVESWKIRAMPMVVSTCLNPAHLTGGGGDCRWHGEPARCRTRESAGWLTG